MIFENLDSRLRGNDKKVAMIRASIITIGNELLSGHSINTNAAYLAERLLTVGISTVTSHTTSDEIDSIARALRQSQEEADIIIITGGLGPTSDDITRDALAEFLGVKLEFKQELLEEIEQFFKRRNLKMSGKNKQQALLPAGAAAIKNSLGTAPGIKAVLQGKSIFALPGVPAEMKKMFEESILPDMRELAANTKEGIILVRKLHCFGAGESTIAEMISEFCSRDRNPLINFTASNGIITLHITASADSINKAEKMADADMKVLKEKLGQLVFGVDGQSLAEVVGHALRKNNKTIAIAESCTAGVLASLLTEIPGASDYFHYGWITYSNEAKINELNVPAELIERYGAVSSQVAEAMAKAARSRAKADIAVAITGIAGPAGATEQKTVGLVYISVETTADNNTSRFIFPGHRTAVRLRAAHTALNLARLAILKFD